MLTQRCDSPIAHPHSFYIPTRMANLNGLSISGEPDTGQKHSILMIVTGGNGTIELEGKPHNIAYGTLLCCSSTLSVSLHPQYQLHGLWIEYSTLSPQPAGANPLNNGIPFNAGSSKACTLATELLKTWEAPAQDTPFALQKLFSELLVELYRTKVECAQASSTTSYRNAL